MHHTKSQHPPTLEIFIKVPIPICQADGAVVGAQQCGIAEWQRLNQLGLLLDGVRQPRVYGDSAALAHVCAHIAVAPVGQPATGASGPLRPACLAEGMEQPLQLSMS